MYILRHATPYIIYFETYLLIQPYTTLCNIACIIYTVHYTTIHRCNTMYPQHINVSHDNSIHVTVSMLQPQYTLCMHIVCTVYTTPRYIATTRCIHNTLMYPMTAVSMLQPRSSIATPQRVMA